MKRRLPALLAATALTAAAAASTQGATVGAFWAFQPATNTATASSSLGSNLTFTPNVDTLAGSPTLTTTSSSALQAFSPGGPSFTDFQSTVWGGGNHAGWNTNTTGNSFTLNLDTTDVEDLNIRYDYRITNGGSTAYTLDYRVGGSGGFTSISSPPALTANSNYQVWSLDLASLNAIEDQSQVEIRWSLPSMGSNITFRLDNVQVTGTQVPEPAAVAGLLGVGAVTMMRRRHR